MTLTHKAWTVDSFNRLVELGVFGSDERVELIEGAIVELPPPGPEHSYAISDLTTRFVRYFGDTHRVRVQLPLALGSSQPQPDFALVRLQDDADPSRHPTRADLVIEVSHDRNEKNSLYAKAGIAEFWVLNLVAHQVEVYRRPSPSPGAPYGFAYASLEIFRGTETLSPAFRPSVVFSAAELA